MFLLFILLLYSGGAASSSIDVQGCVGGWFEFSCSYPPGSAVSVQVFTSSSNLTLRDNQWIQIEPQRYLQHNSSSNSLTMVLKELRQEDFGEYICSIDGQNTTIFRLTNDLVCPVATTTQSTIDCAEQVDFLCKERDVFYCDSILQDQTISNVSVQDSGVYWCGNRSLSQGYRVSRLRVHRNVQEVHGCLGGWAEFTCSYPNVSENSGIIQVTTSKATIITKIDNDWIELGMRQFLHHNSTGLSLTMVLKELKEKDFGEYDFSVCGSNANIFRLINDGTCSEAVEDDCSPSRVVFSCGNGGYKCDRRATARDVSEHTEKVYWCGTDTHAQGYQVSQQRLLRNSTVVWNSLLTITLVCGAVMLLLVLAAVYLKRKNILLTRTSQKEVLVNHDSIGTETQNTEAMETEEIDPYAVMETENPSTTDYYNTRPNVTATQ